MQKTEKNCCTPAAVSSLTIHSLLHLLNSVFCQYGVKSDIFSAVADSELISQIQTENTKQGFRIQCNPVKININIKITLLNTIFFSFI